MFRMIDSAGAFVRSCSIECIAYTTTTAKRGQLAVLLVKQLSKPLANRIKKVAVSKLPIFGFRSPALLWNDGPAAR